MHRQLARWFRCVSPVGTGDVRILSEARYRFIQGAGLDSLFKVVLGRL